MTPKKMPITIANIVHVYSWLKSKRTINVEYIMKFSLVDIFKNLKRNTKANYPIIKAIQFA